MHILNKVCTKKDAELVCCCMSSENKDGRQDIVAILQTCATLAFLTIPRTALGGPFGTSQGGFGRVCVTSWKPSRSSFHSVAAHIAACKLFSCCACFTALFKTESYQMDGGFRAESQGAEGDYGSDGQRGFRGTSENAKTKICMRCSLATQHSWPG